MDFACWLSEFSDALEAAFGERLVFLGIQGSRARGEALADSDIDTVVILDHLDTGDLVQFRAAVKELPGSEKLCGFVSSAEVLSAWDRGELFQFVRDTVPLKGDLLSLTPPTGEAEARKAVHTGACSLYHACCHNLLYSRSTEIIKGLYKTARFVLRAKAFVDSGVDCPDLDGLCRVLSGEDKAILERSILLRGDKEAADELETWSAPLLDWSGRLIAAYRERDDAI